MIEKDEGEEGQEMLDEYSKSKKVHQNSFPPKIQREQTFSCDSQALSVQLLSTNAIKKQPQKSCLREYENYFEWFVLGNGLKLAKLEIRGTAIST